MTQPKIEYCGGRLASSSMMKNWLPVVPGPPLAMARTPRSYGTVGGGCGESQIKSAALRCILTTKKPEYLEIDLTDDFGTKGGDVCGGRMWAFVEPMLNND